MIDSLLLMLETCISDSAKWPFGCKQVGQQSDSGNCALTTGAMSSHPLHEPGNALKLDPIGFCSCFLSFITGGNWHESGIADWRSLQSHPQTCRLGTGHTMTTWRAVCGIRQKWLSLRLHELWLSWKMLPAGNSHLPSLSCSSSWALPNLCCDLLLSEL